MEDFEKGLMLLGMVSPLSEAELKEKEELEARENQIEYTGGLNENLVMQAYNEMWEYENEIDVHNQAILSTLGRRVQASFSELTSGCTINGKMEYVPHPQGDKQHESYGIFQNIHVDQWSTGDGGDTFAGFIYARCRKKWLKIPYYC